MVLVVGSTNHVTRSKRFSGCFLAERVQIGTLWGCTKNSSGCKAMGENGYFQVVHSVSVVTEDTVPGTVSCHCICILGIIDNEE